MIWFFPLRSSVSCGYVEHLMLLCNGQQMHQARWLNHHTARVRVCLLAPKGAAVAIKRIVKQPKWSKWLQIYSYLLSTHLLLLTPFMLTPHPAKFSSFRTRACESPIPLLHLTTSNLSSALSLDSSGCGK